jgi:hypothetical protein
MEKSMKKMSIKEFTRLGYLQELNRQFLHPLGLALMVSTTVDDDKILGGIIDARDDLEGFIYNFRNTNKPILELCRKKMAYIEAEMEKRKSERIKLFGYSIEPIK